MSSFWRVARRRWYLAVAGLLVTAGLVAVAIHAVPAKYEAKSTVLLLPPNNATGNNPYLGLSGYDAFADVVARAMTDTHTVQTLRRQGVSDSFDVARDLTTNGPLVLVTVNGTDARQVLSELASVVSTIPKVLTTLQDDASVATRYQFTSEPLTHPQQATTVRKTQVRAVLVAAVAGLFLTALAIMASDRLLRLARRTWRRLTGGRAAGRAAPAAQREPAEPDAAVSDAEDAGADGRSRGDGAGSGKPAGGRKPRTSAPAAEESLSDVDLDAELAAVSSAERSRRTPQPARSAQRRRV
jgi:hypothetical protein